MEQQYHGSYLDADGDWVSRPTDTVQALSATRQQEQQNIVKPDPEVPRDKTVRLGIVSRTVLPSPAVKFILPANIRHRKLNDIVFVSEHSVHLKEARPNGPLRHVASKSDFKGTILAARVFGNRRTASEVKAEHGTPIKKKDIRAHRNSLVGGETNIVPGKEADILPSEVLVLTLDSRALMFLWAQQAPTGTVKFCHETIRLPSATSLIDRPGAFLAVDPKCRAIAVAALEGQFILYKTRTLDTLREDVRNGREPMLVEDERVINIHGRIMHMEFLTPGIEQDDSHVILAFVIAHGGRTKITCYDWDANHDLNTARARAERVNVDSEDHNPSLLIPLNRSPDFLLVFDRHISTYKNILSGTTSERYKTPVPDEIFRPLHPGDSKTHPRWVQWQTVARNDDFPKEAFYIVREDGKVMYTEVPSSKLPEICDAGQLPYPIDTGFACLEVDASTLNRLQPDVLVAAGVFSDGCLAKIGAWVSEGREVPYHTTMKLSTVESIPNWAPIVDLTVTRLPRTRTPYERERDSLFVATGRAPHGALTELRHGIRAPFFEYGEGMEGITGLSVIDYGIEHISPGGKQCTKHYATILVNSPEESFLLRASLFNSDEYPEIDLFPRVNEPCQDGILRDEETKSACMLPGYAIQVTRKVARVLSRPSLGLVDSLAFDSTVLVAATHSSMSLIAVAYRENLDTILQATEVSADGSFGSSFRYTLTCDPTCIELMDIRGKPHIFVGTIASSLLLIEVSPTGLDVVWTYNLGGSDSSQDIALATACESAVLLTCPGEEGCEGIYMLCGTRDGNLYSLALRSDKETRFGLVDRVRMGTTSVRVTRSTTDSSVAFVSCGPDFCRVYRQRQALNVMGSIAVIDSIWFSDLRKDDYQQHSVTAVDQLPASRSCEDSERPLAGFIFAISGGRILAAQLEYDMGGSPSLTPEKAKVVPRKIWSGPTPSKLTYTEHLQKIIVTATEPKEIRPPPDGYRTITSSLQLVNTADAGEVMVEDEDHHTAPRNKFVVAEFPLKNYERVYSLLEWVLDDDDKRYHFVCVGTGIMVEPGREEGRMRLLKFKRPNSTIQQSMCKDHKSPVRCMALFNDRHLVYIVGKTMYLAKFDMANIKWATVGSLDLYSEGVHLSISDSFVYVSTAEHSHLCYKINLASQPDTAGVHRPLFDKVFSDSRQRFLAHHAVVKVDLCGYSTALGATPPRSATVALLADKTCTVTGLLHPPHRMKKSDTYAVFEAHLPRSVTRLQRGDIRPPWRRPVEGPPPGVLVDDIIGTCSDGTVYGFSILSEPAFELLKFFHDLIEKHESRQPTSKHSLVRRSESSGRWFSYLQDQDEAKKADDGLITARDVAFDYQKAKPKDWYVDADVIVRYLDSGKDLWLLVNNNTTEDVHDLFIELCACLDEGWCGSLEQPEVLEKWLRTVTMALL